MATAVIFDLDGTLIDSAPAICDIVNTLLQELGVPPISQQESKYFMGYGALRFVEQVLAHRGVDAEASARNLARFLDLYERAPPEANPPYPGVETALDTLLRRGCRIGLCTNKPTVPTMLVLKALRWDGIFASVITGDTLPERKPSPEPLFAAVRKLGVQSCVFIGDSEVDAEAARAARLPFVLHEQGYRKSSVARIGADASFATYDELPGVVATLTRAA